MTAQEVRLRTVEQICSKTNEILEQAHQIDGLDMNKEEKVAELNRLTGILETLLWIRYMSQELN